METFHFCHENWSIYLYIYFFISVFTFTTQILGPADNYINFESKARERKHAAHWTSHDADPGTIFFILNVSNTLFYACSMDKIDILLDLMKDNFTAST